MRTHEETKGNRSGPCGAFGKLGKGTSQDGRKPVSTARAAGFVYLLMSLHICAGHSVHICVGVSPAIRITWVAKQL